MNEVTASIDDNIKTKIYTIRVLQVMLDRDLAELYEVKTKNPNRAVNRNSDRFPPKFMFQLSEDEYQNLRFQFGTSSTSGSLRSQIVTSSLVSQNVTPNQYEGRRYLPYMFTEQGVAMLSEVVRSSIAVSINIHLRESSERINY